MALFLTLIGCGSDVTHPTAGADADEVSSGAGAARGSAGGASGGTQAAGGSVASGSSANTGGDASGSPAGSGGVDAGASGNDDEGGKAGAGGSKGSKEPHWVGTWATGNQVVEPENRPSDPAELANYTLRQVVRVSIGGSQLRLRLSNEYGTAPVTMNAVHVAKATTGSSIDTASDVALKFGGSESVTIPAQGTATSDPFDFPLDPLASVAISIAFGERSGEYSGHPGSRATSYIQSGNQVSAESIAGTTTDHWYYIANIDVLAPASTHAIAILGDSITDGRGSTTNGNDRWPDVLAERLQANATKRDIAVLNLGIGGNNMVSGGLGPAGLARFESQILGQAGVKWVVVLQGVNDIGTGMAPSQVTSAYGEIIDKARDAGLLVYGIPILPFNGHAYAANEAGRISANDFIRASGNFDAFLPLDEAVSNGMTPPALDADSDTGDHLHLNPTGLAALANAIDLELFED